MVNVGFKRNLQLRDIRTRQRVILEGVQSGVITMSERGIVESFNQSAEQMFGYGAEEVVGNNVSMLMPEPCQSEHDGYPENDLHSGVRKAIGRRCEVMGRRKDGSRFHMELGVYETLLNDRKLFIGTASDISAHKQAEADLRVAATAFESQESMIITDANEVILKVNKAFTQITGYDQNEAVGKTPKMLKSGRHGDAFYQAMWECIERDKYWQGEMWDRRKNGDIFPLWLAITAVLDEKGGTTNYVGVFSDITAIKKSRVPHSS